MKIRSIVLAMFVVSLSVRYCAAEEELGKLTGHPRLLFNAKGIEQLKAKIGHEPWAKQWAAIKREVDERVGKEVELPPRGGNWSHHYVCPTHGTRLKQGKQIGAWEWEHICPVGNHVLKGDPTNASLDFDGGGISAAHFSNARFALDCGLLYQVTREDRYAARARQILLAYADRYLTYPMHDNNGKPGKGGRIASQSLTEASWVIQACQGADLVWETFSVAQQQAIKEKLFMPAMREVIVPSKLGIHNIQCRHNAAIGLVGLLLDDRELIKLAIDDPKRGFRVQVEKGIQDDGVWCEGAWGYHFFTFDGMWPLAEAARNCGLDLYSPRLKKMLDGPLSLAMPNGVLPAFNDSGEVDLASRDDQYELAYARWGDAAYGAILKNSSRDSRMALWFGAEQLPKAELPTPGSRNAEASGYAVLEKGSGSKATWLCLKYGPHGGGHGHPDKLNFVLYAQGRVLMPDAGTKAYGSPLHAGWDKTTLAHNTLILDETSQTPATGKCLAFGSEGGVDYVIAEAGPIYKDVKAVRTIAMIDPNLILVIDQVTAQAEHQMDLALHFRGACGDLPAGKPWTPSTAAGYRYIEEGTSRSSREPLTASVTFKSSPNAVITLAGGETTELVTGTGIGSSTVDRQPIALFRRKATTTTFAWAISLDGVATGVELVPVQDRDGKPIAASEATGVRVTRGGDRWVVVTNPAQEEVCTAGGGGKAISKPFSVVLQPSAR